MAQRFKEQKAVFKQSIPVAIEALDAALELLREGNDSAVGSLTRIADQLHTDGSAHGFFDISAASLRLATAPQDLLQDRAEYLLTTLRRTLDTSDEFMPEVLVIESDHDAAEWVLGCLERHAGTSVTIVRNGQQALDYLEDKTPHLILLSIILPDQDGRSLLVELKRLPKLDTVPVIMMSALEARTVRSECLLLGADGFITKPLDEKTFLEIVRDALEQLSLEVMEEERNKPLPTILEGTTWLKEQGRIGTVVAFLDMDHFHEVFDHEPLDEVEGILDQVARRINENLREREILYTGDRDDFLLILDGVDLAKAAERIKELQFVVSGQSFQTTNGTQYPLTFSAGLASLTEPGQPDRVLGEGRSALVQAKRKGDNVVHTSGEPDVPPRILLAEDDPMIVKLVQHRLQRAGVDVVVAVNGREALEKGLGGSFDLVMLDVKMPVHDGFEVTRRFRLEPDMKNIPIVLFTSMGSEQDVVRGFELGADDYITKPFSPTELVARLLHLLRKRP